MTIKNDQVNAIEDTTLQIDATHGVLANDTTNNGPLTVVEGLQFTTAGGQIVFFADGSYDYVSPAGFSGTDTVKYTAVDASNTKATGTLTINVAATALVPFVSIGTQLSERTVVAAGFGFIGNGVGTGANTPVALSGGGYVVEVDYQFEADGSHSRLLTYDANNNLVGSFDPPKGLLVRTAALSNGSYAVGWTTIDSATGTQTNHVQVFDATGTPLRRVVIARRGLGLISANRMFEEQESPAASGGAGAFLIATC